jgi:prevent-host-death family protein
MQITATEFKAKCLALIDVVQRTGQPLIISKHGKKVVRLVAEHSPQPWKALRGRGKFLCDPFAPVISESEIEALR